jgi:copper chaperone CopZ
MADAAAYQTARQEVAATEGSHLAFSVDGLTCGDCSDKVTAALKGIDGVKAAAVDYQTGETIVSIDASKTNADALVKAIAKLGYTAQKSVIKS